MDNLSVSVTVDGKQNKEAMKAGTLPAPLQRGFHRPAIASGHARAEATDSARILFVALFNGDDDFDPRRIDTDSGQERAAD